MGGRPLTLRGPRLVSLPSSQVERLRGWSGRGYFVKLSRPRANLGDGRQIGHGVQVGKQSDANDDLLGWLQSVGGDVHTDWFAEKLVPVVLRLPPSLPFDEVVIRTRGAWPAAVAAALTTIGRPILSGSRSEHEPTFERAVELHPLDYEWYFDSETARSLAAALPRNGMKILLGTPSVAAEAADAGTLRGESYLVDQSPYVDIRLPILRRLAKLRSRITNRLPFPNGSADYILFDSPWYLDSIEGWLGASLRALAPSGTIQFVLFQDMVRPTALSERESLLERLESIASVRVEANALSYETPWFERNALRVARIPRVGNWRRADLVTVTQVRRATLPPRAPGHHLAEVAEDEYWHTIVIGSRVVKVRVAGERAAGQLTTIEGCPDDVLPTVSRRDARRRSVGLWTSRNRVAGVADPRSVMIMLQNLKSAPTVSDIPKDRQATRLDELLRGDE